MLRARLQQLILVPLAVYAVRGLVAAVPHAVGAITRCAVSSSLWPVALLAMVLGLMLVQVGRGLNRVATTPRWAMRLVGLGLVVGSVLLVLLSVTGVLNGRELPGYLLGPESPWASASTVLALGLMLSVSTEGGVWLARQHRLTLVVSAAYAVARDPVAACRFAAERQPAAPPVLAGWSDRGPPSRLSPQTI